MVRFFPQISEIRHVFLFVVGFDLVSATNINLEIKFVVFIIKMYVILKTKILNKIKLEWFQKYFVFIHQPVPNINNSIFWNIVFKLH